MIIKIVAGLVLFEIIHLLGAILLTDPNDRETFKQCYFIAFDLIVTFLLCVLIIYGCIIILAV